MMRGIFEPWGNPKEKKAAEIRKMYSDDELRRL